MEDITTWKMDCDGSYIHSALVINGAGSLKPNRNAKATKSAQKMRMTAPKMNPLVL